MCAAIGSTTTACRSSDCKGWSYADVLPYFRRAESFEDGGNPYRGGAGPLKTRKNPAQDHVYDAFIAAAPELGYAANDDYNAAEQAGFGRLQHTIGNGMRCSTAVAYLRPALARGNVTLLTRAQATRILFEGRRAVGIEYVQDGTEARGAHRGRNHSVGRRLQFAAAPDAVGHRPGRRVARQGHRAARRS